MTQIQKLRLLFVLALLAHSTAGLAGFDKALEYYESGRFDRAYAELNDIALLGDPQAMYSLGVMHFQGKSVEKNYIEAYAWMHVAGAAGKEDAAETAENILANLGPDQQAQAKAAAEKRMERYGPDAAKRELCPDLVSDASPEIGLKRVKGEAPRYPRRELEHRERLGVVKLRFTVSEHGYVRDIVPVVSPSTDFLMHAVHAARKWRFAPPGSVGVDSVIRNYDYTINFQINNEGYTESAVNKLLQNTVGLLESARKGNMFSRYLFAEQMMIYRTYADVLGRIEEGAELAGNWYFEAAQQGLPRAQYKLGLDMIAGKGCTVNVEGGYHWIERAAAAGSDAARVAVARRLLSRPSPERIQKAVDRLREAADSEHGPAMVYLAWEQSTSSLDNIRNGLNALDLLDRDPEDYYDEVRILETRAAAYAETGDFDEAVDHQQEAIEEAEDLEWEIPVMKERLKSYQAERPWRGRYYPSEEIKTDKQLNAANEAQATERAPSHD